MATKNRYKADSDLLYTKPLGLLNKSVSALMDAYVAYKRCRDQFD